jgi:hypothetical protein
MSGAPETRYTDRDVRENGELVELAEQYVDGYNGDFQYLIDMKMRVHSGLQLTTPMVKGILNCMRADPRVTGLPTPLPPEENNVVVELKPQKRKKRKPWRSDLACNQVDQKIEHSSHSYDTEEYNGWCIGFHWINRTEPVYTQAKIKVPFVVARGGKMIHLVGDPERHYFDWSPRAHKWGFAYTEYGAANWPVDLHVKLACKYPSFLTKPILLTVDQADLMKEKDGLGFMPYCQHCMAVMSDYL